MFDRLLVVGDVHGHGKVLEKLLHKVNYDATRDKLILLGDYLDRGPDPLYTIGVVMGLVGDGAIALMGNHEDMYLAYLNKKFEESLYLYNGGSTTLRTFKQNSYGYDINKVNNFIKNLPVMHKQDGFIFVHAGLDPMELIDEQDRHDLLWIREDWWFQPYLGDDVVVFGHTPTHVYGNVAKGEVWVQPNRICLDTSAGKGGKLTIMNVLTREYWQEDAP